MLLNETRHVGTRDDVLPREAQPAPCESSASPPREMCRTPSVLLLHKRRVSDSAGHASQLASLPKGFAEPSVVRSCVDSVVAVATEAAPCSISRCTRVACGGVQPRPLEAVEKDVRRTAVNHEASNLIPKDSVFRSVALCPLGGVGVISNNADLSHCNPSDSTCASNGTIMSSERGPPPSTVPSQIVPPVAQGGNMPQRGDLNQLETERPCASTCVGEVLSVKLRKCVAAGLEEGSISGRRSPGIGEIGEIHELNDGVECAWPIDEAVNRPNHSSALAERALGDGECRCLRSAPNGLKKITAGCDDRSCPSGGLVKLHKGESGDRRGQAGRWKEPDSGAGLLASDTVQVRRHTGEGDVGKCPQSGRLRRHSHGERQSDASGTLYSSTHRIHFETEKKGHLHPLLDYEGEVGMGMGGEVRGSRHSTRLPLSGFAGGFAQAPGSRLPPGSVSHTYAGIGQASVAETAQKDSSFPLLERRNYLEEVDARCNAASEDQRKERADKVEHRDADKVEHRDVDKVEHGDADKVEHRDVKSSCETAEQLLVEYQQATRPEVTGKLEPYLLTSSRSLSPDDTETATAEKCGTPPSSPRPLVLLPIPSRRTVNRPTKSLSISERGRRLKASRCQCSLVTSNTAAHKGPRCAVTPGSLPVSCMSYSLSPSGPTPAADAFSVLPPTAELNTADTHAGTDGLHINGKTMVVLPASIHEPATPRASQWLLSPLPCSLDSVGRVRYGDLLKGDAVEDVAQENVRRSWFSRGDGSPSSTTVIRSNGTQHSASESCGSKVDKCKDVPRFATLAVSGYRPPTPPERRRITALHFPNSETDCSCSPLGCQGAAPCLGSPRRRLLLLPGVCPRADREVPTALDWAAASSSHTFTSPRSSAVTQGEKGRSRSVACFPDDAVSLEQEHETGVNQTTNGGAREGQETREPNDGRATPVTSDERDVDSSPSNVPAVPDWRDDLHVEESSIINGYKRKLPLHSSSRTSSPARTQRTGTNGYANREFTSDEEHGAGTPLRFRSSSREACRTGSLARYRRRRRLGTYSDSCIISSELSGAKPVKKDGRKRTVKFSASLCQIYMYEACPGTMGNPEGLDIGGMEDSETSGW